MSIVLGMTLTHDGAVAVVVDGRLRAAIANERLSRVKKAQGVTPEMLAYVLDMVGATLADVTVVTLTAYLYRPDNWIKLFTEDGQEYTSAVLDVSTEGQFGACQVALGDVRKKGVFVHHHLSHCASAYYTSPFARAACFSMDASKDRPEACSLFAYGEGPKLHPLYCPGLMIGNAYHEFTRMLGLGPGIFKAGSTMGLASYGKISALARERWQEFGKSYYARTCMPDDLLFVRRMWSEMSGLPPHTSFRPEQKDSPEAMDLAASLQFIFERVIVEGANRLYAESRNFNDGNICLSGGSFLNCNANTSVKEETPFERVHLFPGCGDDGTAVGSALWVAHHLLDEPRSAYRARDLAYLGREYATPAVGEELNIEQVARILAEGGIVAWYQGRSEFGPRALGNRSVLADPRRAGMRDVINFRVKQREWFRPLAPSVLEERAAEWFDFDGPSPFMLHSSQVKRPKEIPAVTHVDGSARQQTVNRQDNPAFYDLIAAFGRITGVPMLLNTSLNVNNEPLVETPDDALRFFRATAVHALVINDRMLINPAPLNTDEG